MTAWNETRDFVIIGSGAGGLCAALKARNSSADVLVLEKGSMLGGNSAYSGGTMWIPGNALMAEEGISDSIEDGLKYLEGCVPDAGVATTPARRLAYLNEGPKLIMFLRSQGIRLNRVAGYADYYAEVPGANVDGRAVQCDVFDLADLGEWGGFIPRLAPVVGYVQEFPQLALMRRTFRGFRTFVRVAARTKWGKFRGRKLVANGAALVARLLQADIRNGVTVWLESPVIEMITTAGRVAGVRVRHEGEEITVGARRAVLIASGGCARNLELRRRYGRSPASCDWTFSNPGETGEIVQMAMELGAATALMDEAIWIPTTITPLGPIYLEYERGKPHTMLVDQTGQRYVDEGAPYMKYGRIMQDRHAQVGAIPSWLIFDSRHRNHYTFNTAMPGRTPESWISSGFMLRADSLADLAQQCGLNSHALIATAQRFNGFALSGKDEDHHRGETLFSRTMGDPTHGPNPSLGTIERPPFYAIKVFPGDLGTFGGIVTDEHGRVLRADGSVIDGLYATGNATAPVMGRDYPCTGASIASTMIFGSLAVQHALAGEALGEAA